MSKAMKIFTGIFLTCAIGWIAYVNSPIYAEREKYRYWNELVAKNSKPWNVSKEEFIAKNKAGYCWRDKKYYSEEELKSKAMIQFTSTLLNEIEKARNEELIKDGGEIERESEYYCKKEKTGCNLWFAPGEHTNKELKKYLVDNMPASLIGEEELIKFNVKEIVKPRDLKKYSKTSGKYALFGNSFLTNYILGSDCCSVLSKHDFSAITGYRKISAADNFSEQGNIPAGEITENYGIGNYYLAVTFFYYGVEIIGNDENHHYKYARTFNDIKRFYFLSNCGDLLFKPYYSFN